MTVPAIHEDVIELIVQQIGREIVTLKACTLVSRTWYYASRKLLHSLLRYWWGRQHLDVYKNNPHLLDCVKTFAIYSLRHCLAWEYSALQNIRLPNVISLHIVHTRFPEATQLFMYFKQHFPYITSLYLENVWFSQPDGLTSLESFVESFPLLSKLTIRNVNIFSTPCTGKELQETVTKRGDVLARLCHIRLDISRGSTSLLNLEHARAHGIGTAPVTFVNVDMKEGYHRDSKPIAWPEVVWHLDSLACNYGTTLKVLSITQYCGAQISEEDMQG